MNHRRRWICIASLALAGGCALQPAPAPGPLTSRPAPSNSAIATTDPAAISESDALDRVGAIPEVAAFLDAVPKRSHNQVGPLIFSDGQFSDGGEHWLIYVGEDHDDYSVNWHWFKVDCRSGAVAILDAAGGRWIGLEQWRRSTKNGR